MLFLLLATISVTLVIIIYLVIKNKNLQENISRFEEEQRVLRENYLKLYQAITGKTYDGNDQKFGGLEGFGGTRGKVDYLEKKIDSLIDVINQKFIEVGKKINSHELQYGQSLNSEVMSNMFQKKE